MPGALALLLAVAGALGLGPWFGGAGGTFVVVDVSPSCEPLDPVPEGALLCRDSRLGAAIEEAKRAGAKRVLLHTDGCDLSGAPPEPKGIPVDVALRPRRDDLLVLSVRTPDKIPVAADFAVEILVGRTKGPDRPAATAAVTLFRDGERVGSPAAVKLDRGQTARVAVRDRVDREGVVRYRAVVADPVGDPADDTLDALARVGEKPLVIAVGGPLDDARSVTVAEALSAPYDAAEAIVVLALPDAPVQEKIADAVRAGAGLVLVGGRGVAGGPLEKVLPLTDAPPEGRTALLLLDVSGSMEHLMDALADATRKLLAEFRPDDRVAFVLFADAPVKVIPWKRVADARIDLAAQRASGNTLLEPALEEAERLLRDEKGHRRLFVVSDGEWKDRDPARLKERLDRFGGIWRVALFVQEDVPKAAKDLFFRTVTAKDDLGAALRQLEDGARDRTVGSANAGASPAPAWLEGAVPPGGVYYRFPRLYARGVGETIVLHSGDIPILAAWRPGGKVVMCGPSRVDVAALARAVLKETGGMRLRAWRERDEVVAEATGSDGAPFAFDGVPVPARPVGPDRWRATGRHATRISCGAATVLVAGGPAELQGLSNRPDIAAKIAASSGGTLTDVGGARGPDVRAAAAWATLLAAAGLVLVSAWRRRKA